MEPSQHITAVLQLVDRTLPASLQGKAPWDMRLGILCSSTIGLVLVATAPLFWLVVGLADIALACTGMGALFISLGAIWGRLGHRLALPLMLLLCFALQTFAVLRYGGADSPFLPFSLFPVLYAAVLGSPELAVGTGVFAVAYTWGFSALPPTMDVGQPPDAQMFWAVSVPPMVLVGGLIVGGLTRLRATASQAAEDARDEARQAQVAAEEALAIAETASRAKSDFLAIASHELRSPLAGIMGAAELLLHLDEPPDKVKHLAKTIGISGRRMALLVDDLLDLKRIERGDVRFKIQAFDIRELVTGVVAIVDSAPGEGASRVVVEWGPNLPSAVLGDGDRVRQILINLLGNALKFSPSGTITVRASEALVLEVQDEGPGVPESARGDIFEPFFRTEQGPNRNEAGAGLGLAISRRLAMGMGGEIVLLNSPSGAHFRVVLPLPTTTLPGAPADAPESSTSLHVLVVDDDPVILEVAADLLRCLGHEPTSAKSGALALEKCAEKQPDLVLLDWHMPGMDGFETAVKLQQNHPGLTLIGFTASAVEEEIQRAKQAGMETVLRKPMSLGALEGALAAVS